MNLPNRVVAKKNISNSFRGILRVSPDSLGQDSGITGMSQVSDSIGNGTTLFLGTNGVNIVNLSLSGNTSLDGDSLTISTNGINVNSNNIEIRANNLAVNTQDKRVSLNDQIINFSGNINENDILIYKSGEFTPNSLNDFIDDFSSQNDLKPPTGCILMWPINGRIPSGYLLCDGSSYNTSDYPDLYRVIGSTYGGGGSVFNVPDYRNMFIRGASSEREPGLREDSALPNIKGAFDGNVNDGNPKSGAFYVTGNLWNGSDGVASQWGGIIGFNANRYNKIYQDDINEVRPPNISINFIIKY